MSFKTQVATMGNFDKGSIILDDDLKHYAFSNLYEVAGKSAPFERVVVASNLEYCAEVAKIDGASPWYRAPHDEFTIVMEGEVEFTFHQLESDEKPGHDAGAERMSADPKGPRMGLVRGRLGHEVLLPEGAAYQMKSTGKPAVVILQTSLGPESVERWSENCVLE